MLDPPMSTVKTGTEDFAGEGRLTLIGNVAMVEGIFIKMIYSPRWPRNSSMSLHKRMVCDGFWSTVGATIFDNLSWGVERRDERRTTWLPAAASLSKSGAAAGR